MVEFTNSVLQGVGIFFLIVVNLVAIVRIWARLGQYPRFRWDDGWLILAYGFYMATTIAFLVNGEMLFRRTDYITGGPDYPEREADNRVVKVLFFFSSMGFWFTLWSVKSAFMALYKRMMIQLPLYIQLWWAVIAFCVLALAASIGLHVATCANAGGWFGSPVRNCSAKLANTTLWVSYAMDVSSDIMIMILPLTLVRNLQMSFGKKVSLSFLFCLAFFVMICATIRAVQINQKGLRPLPTWTALWSVIETSVAMIVGCGPGLYFSKHQIPLFSKADRLRETSP